MGEEGNIITIIGVEREHNCCYERERRTQLLLWDGNDNTLTAMRKEGEHNYYYGRRRRTQFLL